MSPIPLENKLTKKKTSIFKQVYHKVMRKSSKGDEENDLQPDAIPDMPSKYQQERNTHINSDTKTVNENMPDADLNDKYKFSDKFDYSSRNEPRNDSTSYKSSASEEKTDIPKNPKSNEPNFAMNNATVIVNGSVGFQFGNNVTNNNTVNYVWNNGKMRQQAPPKEKFSYQMTAEIQELLKKEILLEAKHIDFISGYFGKNWKEVGQSLGFTSGELDAAEEKRESYKDKSFEILKRWCQKNGDEATVGKLSSKMWESRILAAMEAVQQLSINISRMM